MAAQTRRCSRRPRGSLCAALLLGAAASSWGCASAPARRPATPESPPAPGSAPNAAAQAPPPDDASISFTDPQDGAFDLSRFLASRVGFMPVPILITEPAVGYGGGLGVMFLHDQFGARDAEGKHQGPPSITGVATGYTESDSWFAGVGHFGSWSDDALRYTGVAGYGLGNLDFFGTAGGPGGTAGERSLPFQIEAVGLRQELLARIPETDLFLGLRYEYADTRTRFDTGVPILDNRDLDTHQAALAFVAQFDTRDNIFTPNRGVNARLSVSRYDEALGGDSNYDRLDLDVPFWVPVGERLVASVHALASFSERAAPFYALPYVTLRGVPALRYQGTAVISIEPELRWNFAGRWSLVGFGGVGQAVNSTSDFGGESETVTAGGGGLRYLIARAFGLQVGIDVARGPEETALYIQVGN